MVTVKRIYFGTVAHIIQIRCLKLKPKVKRCTKSDKVAFRAHIRFTLLIEKYINQAVYSLEFHMGSNKTIL